MKKSVYISLLLMVVLLIACNKEAVIDIDDNQSGPEADKSAQYYYNRILRFQDMVAEYKANPEYKSGGEMGVEDVLWYYNALINFENALPDAAYKGFYRDSVFVTLPVTLDDSVAVGQALAAYLEIEQGMAGIFAAAPFVNKSVKFIIVEVKSANSTEMLLRSTTIIGDDGEMATPPFGYGDDFYYGNNMGMCNGTGIFQYDAGDTICKWINSTRCLHVNDEGKIVFYLNPVRIENIYGNHPAFDNPDDPGTPANPSGYDNHRDYLLFYAHEDNGNLSEVACIGYADMNFYYSGTTTAIYNIIPNLYLNLNGKTFVDVADIDGKNYFDSEEKEYYIHNIKNICYAERVVIEK